MRGGHNDLALAAERRLDNRPGTGLGVVTDDGADGVRRGVFERVITINGAERGAVDAFDDAVLGQRRNCNQARNQSHQGPHNESVQRTYSFLPTHQNKLAQLEPRCGGSYPLPYCILKSVVARSATPTRWAIRV